MRLHVPVAVRWADLDAYGHVNNADVLTLLEEARIEAFWEHEASHEPWPTALLGTGPAAPTQTLIARQEIEYLRPIGYRRDGLRIEMWIGHLGGSSLEVCYEVHDGERGHPRTAPASGAAPYARAATTIVLVSAQSMRPLRLAPAQREAWQPFLEERIAFRRRRSGSAAG